MKKFHACKQGAGETLADYYSRLKYLEKRLLTLGKRKASKDFDEDCKLVLYQGVDKKFKQYVRILKASRGEDITFEEAMEEILNYAIDDGLEPIGKEKQSKVKVEAAFEAKNESRNYGNERHTKYKHQDRKSNTDRVEKRKCHRCGHVGHLKANCRVKKKNFNRCRWPYIAALRNIQARVA